jgi:hypothetical protein
VIYTLEAGDGGIASDLDGMDAAEKLWTNGENIRFENGYFQPFDGHYRLYDPPSVTPYGVFPLRTTSANLWVYTGLAKAYAVSTAGTHYDITRATGGDYTATAATKWTGGALTSFLIFNNENDVPQSWNGNTASDAVNLANWNSTWRCKSIRPLRNYLVAVNITKSSTNYPMMVKWSHAADPGTLPTSWDETDAAKNAGEQDIGDANGYLVDVVPYGDLGIIYSTGAYHSMQYIGGTFIWRFTRLSGDVGAISQNCAVQYPGGHVVLAAGDVFAHSGGQPTSIINRRMRRHLFNAMDGTNYQRSFVAHDEARAEVWVCIPEATESVCTRAYVWNYAQDSWTIRDLPNCVAGNSGPVVTSLSSSWADGTGTWDSAAGPWDGDSVEANRRRLVMASTSSRLYLMDAGDDYDGSTPSAYVERTGLSLGDPSRIKIVKSVRPRIDASIGTVVNIKIGGAMTADGSVAWSAAMPYTVGTSLAAYGFATGKYIGVKFESTAGAVWRCRSLDIEYVFAGVA